MEQTRKCYGRMDGQTNAISILPMRPDQESEQATKIKLPLT